MTKLFAVMNLLIVMATVTYAQPSGLHFRPISDPGAVYTIPTAINNSGSIVGLDQDAVGITHGILISRGRLTRVTHSGSQVTDFYGINNNGQVVGLYSGSGGQQAFLYQNGSFTSVGPAEGAYGAFGINDSSQITGFYYSNDGVAHGYICQGTSRTGCQTLDAPGAVLTYAWDINNAGIVTLWAMNADSTWHAFKYDSTSGYEKH
jgi:probable HAF family extracellular repeat protein